MIEKKKENKVRSLPRAFVISPGDAGAGANMVKTFIENTLVRFIFVNVEVIKIERDYTKTESEIQSTVRSFPNSRALYHFAYVRGLRQISIPVPS